jgi:FkbM family methyltransferase
MCCDCGADIGMFSLVIAARHPEIDQIIAFEPNKEPFKYLSQSLKGLAISTRAMNAAVGKFHGRGRLRIPVYDSSEGAAFIEPAADGDIEVMTVDELALNVTGTILLKVDVEGAELDVIVGAKRTLAACRHFIITIEACRDVIDRTKIEPCEIVSAIRSIRSCDVQVAEEPQVAIDMSRPFFEQFVQRRVYNLVVTST